MLAKILAPVAALLLSAAAPSTCAPVDSLPKFQLLSAESTTPVHLQHVTASNGKLLIRQVGWDAQCTGDNHGAAVFYISDGQLYLYTPQGKPSQRLYTDRSGMGQGVLIYQTGLNSAGLPTNSEYIGWNVGQDGNLYFKGSPLIACPGGPSGAYTIWVGTGVAKPGGNSGCLAFSPRVIKDDNPYTCQYSA